jgi:hypothetical protein
MGQPHVEGQPKRVARETRVNHPDGKVSHPITLTAGDFQRFSLVAEILHRTGNGTVTLIPAAEEKQVDVHGQPLRDDATVYMMTTDIGAEELFGVVMNRAQIAVRKQPQDADPFEAFAAVLPQALEDATEIINEVIDKT